MFPLLLNAQISSVAFEEVPIEINGRKAGRITDISQDNNGYIWLTSAQGLIRYDGYTFKNYRFDRSDSTALITGGNESLFIDHTGDLWTGTSEGVSRYEASCDCFFFYRFESNDVTPKDLQSAPVIAFAEDIDQNLWMAQQGGGLYRYEREEDRFTRFLDNPTDPNSIIRDVVRVLLADSNGNIWIGTGFGEPENGTGLIRFNPRTGKVKRFLHDPANPNSLIDNRISALMEDQEGKLWVGTYQCGLHLYHPDTEDFSRLTADEEQLNKIYAPCTENPVWGNAPFVKILHQDQNGGYWIGTTGVGLNHFDPITGELSFYNIEKATRSPASLWTIHEDRQGIIWLGLLDAVGGLQKMDPQGRQYTLYPALKAVQRSMESRKEPGAFWISTIEDGLYRLDISTGKTSRLLPDQKTTSAVYEDRNGILWVGLGHISNLKGQKTGLARLDPANGSFKHYPIKSQGDSSPGNTVFQIYEDQKGNLWLDCLRQGLFRFDKHTETYKAYQLPGSSGSEISIWPTKDNNTLWVIDLSRNILFKYNEQQDQFIPFLEGYRTTYVLEYDSNRYWIGTEDKGLLHYNSIDSTLIQYTIADGLPSNDGVHFLQDETGILWIATRKGLAKLDPRTKKIISDGMPQDYFHFNAFKSRDGQLFFGGNKGLYAIDPKKYNGNPFPPEVLISGLQISGEPYQVGSAMTQQMKLSHQQNDFRFEYLGIHYSNPTGNRYQYKLSPFDSEWIDAGTERNARYTNLKPGTYNFQVKAANSDGVWQEAAAAVAFKIRPPWWQTWWAYSLFIAVALLSIQWLLKTQKRKLQLKQQELDQERQVSERLKQVDRLKDQFLANTSHELRTPLHGIIGLSETLHEQVKDEEQRKNIEMVIASGIRLTNLVNDILDFSKLKTHEIELHLQAVDLKSVVDIVLRMSRGLSNRKALQLVDEIDDNLPAILADEDRLQQILLNLVGNAIKFTAEGQVTISAHRAGEDQLKITVADTGIGIPQDKLPHVFQSFEQGDASTQRQYGGTGLGLTITRQLVELHGGKIEVESEVDKGSIFTFSLAVANGKPAPRVAKPLVENLTALKIVETKAVSPQTVDRVIPKEIGKGQYHILIVDDDPVNQQVMSNYLSKSNFIISQAADGQEALAILENEVKIDIVLLDIMMPGMSGYEVCQKIRERFLPNELPILMITAKNQIADLVEALKIDANDYLVKPISKKELLARLGTHLNLLHINQAYSRFVPKDFFKVLGKENILDVHLGDQVEGEVTVMFSDIRGYTPLSESMTAADNFKFLNAYLKKAVPIINDHNGLVQHFLGDGLMSLFLDKPNDAVVASITYLKMVTQYSLERMAKGRKALRVGIGLHTGTLMLGIIGNENRMDTGVVSDTVNTASRMEGLSKHFGISLLISETVFNNLENPEQFNYRDLGKVQVKGKKKALKVYDFFDGETVEIIGLKKRTLTDFSTGLQQYYAKNFTAAALSFEKVLLSNPGDVAARMYREKSSDFIDNGVAEGWTGIEVMTNK